MAQMCRSLVFFSHYNILNLRLPGPFGFFEFFNAQKPNVDASQVLRIVSGMSSCSTVETAPKRKERYCPVADWALVKERVRSGESRGASKVPADGPTQPLTLFRTTM